MKKLVLLSWIITISITQVSAQLSVPGFFSDNMVLQRDKDIVIWGKANSQAKVTVVFDKNKKTVRADKKGHWKVTFDPLPAGGPYTINVKSGNECVIIKDVRMGELWIASGQSNMEFRLMAARDAEKEIANANYPLIRTFNVERAMSYQAKNDVKGWWRICKPELASDFSAVAYFFAREIHEKLNVPVGIINTSWGGTDIETWMSMTSIEKFPLYDKLLDRMRSPEFELYVQQSEQIKASFENAFKTETGITEQWYAEQYNTETWRKHPVPCLWNSEDLSHLDGVVWFTFEFNLPENIEPAEALLSLGQIDDDDITWVNGVKIGETAGYDIKREYKIPAGVLKNKNRITIKISDYRGGGGLYGVAENIYLKVADQKIPLAGEWKYKISVSNEEYDFVDYGPNAYPSLLYNAMLNPLIGLGIRGVIWYQGENNAARASEYNALFSTMITDWRQKWNDEFSFYWVQLANFMASTQEPSESHWANLREAQSATLSLPKTGQAVTIDIGDADDIHPRNKQDVGKRLALCALFHDYGFIDFTWSGPTYKSIESVDGELIVSFDHVANGLCAKDKYGYLKGFAVAGEDGKYYWAKAVIKDNKVFLKSKQVSHPVSVRYAWADNPDDANLYNSAGLPASPFQATIK